VVVVTSRRRIREVAESNRWERWATWPGLEIYRKQGADGRWNLLQVLYRVGEGGGVSRWWYALAYSRGPSFENPSEERDEPTIERLRDLLAHLRADR
jgi:hypothetical protein